MMVVPNVDIMKTKVIHVVFESSDPSLAALQTKTYVGSGRFILEAGKAPVVEYKISEVVHN